jgi:hypothetical protein
MRFGSVGTFLAAVFALAAPAAAQTSDPAQVLADEQVVAAPPPADLEAKVAADFSTSIRMLEAAHDSPRANAAKEALPSSGSAARKP